MLYHVHSGWLPGGFIGVDIFFVISGFLITQQMLREREKTGRIGLVRFYSKRMTRLIPAATAVLMVTAGSVYLFVPRIHWSQFGQDIVGAGAYVINWTLAARSVDYLAEDAAASPVQHFWSLAVEEQFYLLWPLLIILAGYAASRMKGSHFARIFLGIAIIATALSLTYAIWANFDGDATAYFSSLSRLWELAVGGAAAISVPFIRSRIGVLASELVTALGVALVLFSLVTIDAEQGWPSPLTILPVMGTVLVLTLGNDRSFRSPVTKVLGARPMVWIGGLSYSFYLWHWPLIVLAAYATSSASTWVSVVAAAVSIPVAWLSLRLIENPVRYSEWARSKTRHGIYIGLGGAATSIIFGLLLVLAAPQNILLKPDGAVAEGAKILAPVVAETSPALLSEPPAWITPDPMNATSDVPAIYADDCQQVDADAEAISCTYGDTDSPKVVALVGDSKAAQWLPALDAFAQTSGLRLVTFAKSRCAFTDSLPLVGGKPYNACAAWNLNVLDDLRELKPVSVITSQVGTKAASSETSVTESEEMSQGMARQWQKVMDMGTQVIVIGDNPNPGSNVYECVAENPEMIDSCSFDKTAAVARSALPLQLEALASLGGRVISASGDETSGADTRIALLDLTDAVCPTSGSGTKCQPVIGNVLVYRQGSHLTKTYVQSMENRLDPLLDRAGVLGK
ncbi:hypothetical protein ASF06_01715 [Agreia sp. Leaf244]|nr:hypothetical protein ASF06_01715 [Agreia sp. Leaf244]